MCDYSFTRMMTHLKSFTESVPVSRCGRLFSLPQQCPVIAIAKPHLLRRKYKVTVNGGERLHAADADTDLRAAQQNFLLRALVTDQQSAGTCQRSSLRAAGRRQWQPCLKRCDVL